MRFIIIDKSDTESNSKYYPFYTVDNPEEVLEKLDMLFTDRELIDKAYFWCQSVLWNDEYKTELFEIRARF